MNVLLMLGLLTLVGYLIGRCLNALGLPKIIGYILTGMVFSPHSFGFVSPEALDSTPPLLAICLGFIAFQVGGELKWNVIKEHEKEIVGITLMASLAPYFFILMAFYGLYFVQPDLFSSLGGAQDVLAFSIILAALAGPTDPTATMAIIHQYRAKGKVKDTILGVAALDDALGVLLFSVSVAVAATIMGSQGEILTALGSSVFHIVGGISIGIITAFLMNLLLRYLRVEGEGQWIVLIFSMISLSYGVASYLEVDELLACMTAGLILVNLSKKSQVIFKVLERYTEELIYLLFFVLSGLYLDMQSISQAAIPILMFILVRTLGKYVGSYAGASLAQSSPSIKKYTAGGLIPQGGIVIGLALVLEQYESFRNFSGYLLAVVMGATVVHEILGPFMARYSLAKAGELEAPEQDSEHESNP